MVSRLLHKPWPRSLSNIFFFGVPYFLTQTSIFCFACTATVKLFCWCIFSSWPSGGAVFHAASALSVWLNHFIHTQNAKWDAEAHINEQQQPQQQQHQAFQVIVAIRDASSLRVPAAVNDPFLRYMNTHTGSHAARRPAGVLAQIGERT